MDFPWNYDGLPTGWSNQVMVARRMETSVYRVMPKTSFPQHNSPDEFIGIMISGEIILEICELGGGVTDTVVCVAGDRFSFGKHMHHAWRNDSDSIAIMAFTRKLD